MERTLKDLIYELIPLNKEQKANIKALESYLEKDEVKHAKYLLKLKRIGIIYEKFGISTNIIKENAHPKIFLATEDKKLSSTIQPWNAKIAKKAEEKTFNDFSEKASETIPKTIAPNIIGFEEVKEAASWQLFCPERIHILLLGDPGTGKTDILRSIANIAPISSFGLGSGTSGAGLSAAKKGKELMKGLLPLAHKGICCIDELNLMKNKDRGALLNAMEKGFVTYDKGGEHLQLKAETRILATANPKGDRFIGKKVSFLKNQLPFDPALLSRFHLVFLYRKPDLKEFMKITKSIITEKNAKITKEDTNFLKGYVSYAQKQKVEFDKKLEPVITDFFEDLKNKEDEYLIELSPRFVLGVVRMAKAEARMNLKEKVTHNDLIKVLKVVKKSLKITEDKKRQKIN